MLMLGVAAMLAAPMTVKAGGVYDGPKPGTSIVGVRLGVSNTVGANVTYDYALARVWKGAFTIGGQVGYMWDGNSSKMWNNGHTQKAKWANNYLSFRVRTTYRFNVVVPQWEVYGGVALGGGVNCWSTKNRWAADGLSLEKDSGASGFFSGAFILGTTYHFTDAIGLNLEFDFGDWATAWVNLGVNIRL